MYVKNIVSNPALCKCKNSKYLASITDDLAIICDEVIDTDDETKPIPTNFNEKKVICKMQNFYHLLACLLITIALLIVISIYCYWMKYRSI